MLARTADLQEDSYKYLCIIFSCNNQMTVLYLYNFCLLFFSYSYEEKRQRLETIKKLKSNYAERFARLSVLVQICYKATALDSSQYIFNFN